MKNEHIVNIHGKEYIVFKDGSIYTKLKGGIMKGGYRYVQPGGRGCKQVYIHHLVMELFGPKKPDGKHFICHKNGNSLDNNIENLYWGTPKQNTRDSIKHKTFPRGEKQGKSKLTEEDVRWILKMHKRNPLRRAFLAHRFGVGLSTIDDIYQGKTWRHITEGRIYYDK